VRALGLGLLLIAVRASAADAAIVDCVHDSAVFNEQRHYRIFLPPAYASTDRRYPVIYWFHGHGERYNKGPASKEYDQGSDYGGDNIAHFVATHDVLVVKWDGYNPRKPGEDYPRPYNIGPVETDRQFALYFPELVAYIDAHYRTIADRDHRATSGISMGGFMSFWIAGKYPDLVSSASNFMGSPEFVVGPREFPVEYSHDVMAGNYDGVRTRLVTGSRDFIQFYHRRMNLLWTQPSHETEDFDFDHGVPALAKTLAFHMEAFEYPLPQPHVWSHADVYPTFSVWDWTVQTDRKKPGFTWLESASHTGFHSVVREWLPRGKIVPGIHVRIVTAPYYRKNQRVPVTTIRLRDNKIEQRHEFADANGRLEFQLDGDDYQVTIGKNLVHRTVEAPKVPPAPLATDFQIADHRKVQVFEHATQKQSRTLGLGNGDGKANPGEVIAILLPDGDAFRPAELFSDDDCVDLSSRVSDDWRDYDWVGASAKYTLAKLNCPAGHVIRLRARVLLPNKPNHQVKEVEIELPVFAIQR